MAIFPAIQLCGIALAVIQRDSNNRVRLPLVIEGKQHFIVGYNGFEFDHETYGATQISSFDPLKMNPMTENGKPFQEYGRNFFRALYSESVPSKEIGDELRIRVVLYLEDGSLLAIDAEGKLCYKKAKEEKLSRRVSAWRDLRAYQYKTISQYIGLMDRVKK